MRRRTSQTKAVFLPLMLTQTKAVFLPLFVSQRKKENVVLSYPSAVFLPLSCLLTVVVLPRAAVFPPRELPTTTTATNDFKSLSLHCEV